MLSSLFWLIHCPRCWWSTACCHMSGKWRQAGTSWWASPERWRLSAISCMTSLWRRITACFVHLTSLDNRHITALNTSRYITIVELVRSYSAIAQVSLSSLFDPPLTRTCRNTVCGFLRHCLQSQQALQGIFHQNGFIWISSFWPSSKRPWSPSTFSSTPFHCRE